MFLFLHQKHIRSDHWLDDVLPRENLLVLWRFLWWLEWGAKLWIVSELFWSYVTLLDSKEFLCILTKKWDLIKRIVTLCSNKAFIYKMLHKATGKRLDMTTFCVRPFNAFFWLGLLSHFFVNSALWVINFYFVCRPRFHDNSTCISLNNYLLRFSMVM